ncbi:3-isopropylmalate dehydratase large subunit, chloroplastic-like isoform X1 [Manihot esculenta]|uniref:3-isopropylmalate dehydratase large subunit, chloroplastic-like isoform X1 n=1 Tax=Manihot esculenta TaxID=3983 RepID=UPI001CC5006C|nr:3-isopropylmalate dehydratase large subunit, chloroplastic-like isoform X1 [Manihot esculenta]XP_043805215.1 3-isopropylmalate dehydratase large subunit, chloroplastic-like isoform X1 [Manihot esculenta]XP_043805216.1 3-isopropylmalate dehydratase large subunit, chloroplastic-like isoform X1 [Manihot esculenta]XP_043805217.1 3-isopropylmalate dehydratase large subunit, chloroplastic-like isoform X1 [Manihot esculenta]XP_043805218.1 3-isopropylmalate dehydratase large subunit, chloroplastic-l
MVDQGQLITQAVSIPVIGDGDNGYGNAMNVKRTIKGFIKAGFAGIILEDQVLLGTDSHTCTAGAFGQFATGIGITDAGFVLGTGKLLLKVPPTLRFVMDGEMADYLLAKDLILQIKSEMCAIKPRTLWLLLKFF